MYDFFVRVRSHFCSIILITTLISCKGVAPRDGLVGEYLFNNNASDKSKFRNHGSVNGATITKGHTGKPNSAYHFNGSDQYIAIPHADHINFEHDQDFTISFWVFVENQADVNGTLNDIMRKWRGDTQGYPFAIVYYHNNAPDEFRNRFSFVRYDGSICRDSPQVLVPTTELNSFIHLACMKQGSQLKMYVNGALVSQATDTTRPSTTCGSKNNCEVTIGTRGNRVRFFTGVVDDLRFYNRALSEKEIGLLYKL
ncbi:MAG TPA: LamG domain-containing protein [Chryseolinea sp.]